MPVKCSLCNKRRILVPKTSRDVSRRLEQRRVVRQQAATDKSDDLGPFGVRRSDLKSGLDRFLRDARLVVHVTSCKPELAQYSMCRLDRVSVMSISWWLLATVDRFNGPTYKSPCFGQHIFLTL